VLLARFSNSKFSKNLNMKVGDLATLYNLAKADCGLDSNRERN
jgi:hypothetical protein